MTGYDLVAWLIIYVFVHIMFIRPFLYLGGLFGKKVLRVVLPPTLWILKQFQKEKVYYAEGAKDEALTYSEEYEIKEPSFDG